jgi:arylsulfatase A-like enzyme
MQESSCSKFPWLAAILLVLLAGPSPAAETAPNIIFILADDMGYGDVRVLNSESQILTPSLDRIAREGMTFHDAHSPSAVCTPTRYGLLTGRYCWRSSLKRGVLNGYGTPLIEKDRPTVAAVLQQAGYHTGIVGKWHLGLNFGKGEDGKSLDFSKPVEDNPGTRGFDDSYIIPASLDFPPYVYIENGRVTNPVTVEQPAQKFPAFLRKGPRSVDLVMEDCLDDLLLQATNFIRRRSGQEQPFFLYFPLGAPHKPVLPHSRFRGTTKLGPYGDFIAQVDWTVGQVLKTLDECGITDNTLVIYTSDNGSYMHRRDADDAAGHVDDQTIQAFRADRHRSNHVFRGTKADIWEAGHHVPFLARWPGMIEPGSRCDQTICLVDFFATAAEIAGAGIPKGAAQDSFSLLSLMQGKSWARQRDPVIHHSAGGAFAIRQGKWKLVLCNGSGGREMPRGKPFQKPYFLFDMSQDISERQNVIEDHPEIARRMEKKCLELRDRDY